MKKLIYQFIFTAIALLVIITSGLSQVSSAEKKIEGNTNHYRLNDQITFGEKLKLDGIVTESIEIFNKTKVTYKLIGTVKTPKEGYINANDKFIVTYQLIFQSQDATNLSNVVIRDKLPKALDANSVRVKASHSDYGLLILKGNELEFNFQSMYLPEGETTVLEFELEVDPIMKTNNVLNEVAIYIDNELSGRVNEEIYWLNEGYTQANIADFNIEKALVCPNPARYNVHIQNINSGELILMDLSGNQLLRTTIEGTHTLDLSSYLSGTYILQITQAGRVETHRIMKVR